MAEASTGNQKLVSDDTPKGAWVHPWMDSGVPQPRAAVDKEPRKRPCRGT